MNVIVLTARYRHQVGTCFTWSPESIISIYADNEKNRVHCESFKNNHSTEDNKIEWAIIEVLN